MKLDYASHEDFTAWLKMRRILFPWCGDECGAEMKEILATFPSQACIIAKSDDGHPIGFAECRIRAIVDGCTGRRVGYLEAWYVEPPCRRQGVGSALVAHAIQWAKDQACDEFASDCDLSNDISRQAHLALGFEETMRLIHFRKPL